MQQLPIHVVAGLVLTPLLVSAGQILFKRASEHAGAPDLSGLVPLLLNPYLITALVIYGVGTIVWVYVLKTVPLITAYPFMALTFCAVPALAWLFLGETLTLRYALGTGLIIAGVLIVNS